MRVTRSNECALDSHGLEVAGRGSPQKDDEPPAWPLGSSSQNRNPMPSLANADPTQSHANEQSAHGASVHAPARPLGATREMRPVPPPGGR